VLTGPGSRPAFQDFDSTCHGGDRRQGALHCTDGKVVHRVMEDRDAFGAYIIELGDRREPSLPKGSVLYSSPISEYA
jgi:hypothetical protein